MQNTRKIMDRKIEQSMDYEIGVFTTRIWDDVVNIREKREMNGVLLIAGRG